MRQKVFCGYLAVFLLRKSIMPLSREKKQEILKTIKENIKKAKVILFVNFHGLNVLKSQKLRRILKKIGAEYLVAKKTLLKKVLDDFDFSEERPDLEGEIGLVFGYEDEVSPSKEINIFSKAKEVRILGGILGKKYIDEEAVKTLATIPAKDVLLGQLAGAINAPLRQLVGVLQGPMRDLVIVLSRIKTS